MKNKFLLPGMLIGLLTFSLTVFGCEDGSTDDDDGGIGVTVSFAAAGANAFTLTLSKGTWEVLPTVANYAPGATFYSVTDKTGGLSSIATNAGGFSSLTAVRQSDQKVMKVTLSKHTNTGTFKISLDATETGITALATFLSQHVSGLTTEDRAALTIEANDPVTITFN